MFGRTPKPVPCGLNLTLGNGEVYPELNFTLPTKALDEANWFSVVAQYEEIGLIIERATVRLKPPGLMIEFELLPPMTEHPAWGAETSYSEVDTKNKIDALVATLESNRFNKEA